MVVAYNVIVLDTLNTLIQKKCVSFHRYDAPFAIGPITVSQLASGSVLMSRTHPYSEERWAMAANSGSNVYFILFVRYTF